MQNIIARAEFMPSVFTGCQLEVRKAAGAAAGAVGSQAGCVQPHLPGGARRSRRDARSAWIAAC